MREQKPLPDLRSEPVVDLRTISKEVDTTYKRVLRRYAKFNYRYKKYGSRKLDKPKISRCYKKVRAFMSRLNYLDGEIRRSKSRSAPLLLRKIEISRKIAARYKEKVKKLNLQ